MLDYDYDGRPRGEGVKSYRGRFKKKYFLKI